MNTQSANAVAAVSGQPAESAIGKLAAAEPEPLASEVGRPELVLEPSIVETPDSNAEITLESVSPLVQSIMASGQLLPGIVAKHPTKPGWYICLDGNRRLLAVRVLGRKFRAVMHAGKITPGALAKTRIISNRSGKRMTDDQLAADLEAIQAEEGCTQEEAARQCGVSAAEASKAKKFMEQALQEVKDALAAKQIVRDTARAIASVPQEKQKEFLERAIRNDMRSDTAEKIAKELRGKGGPKEKTWTTKVGKHVATIKGDLLVGAEAMINRLQEIVKRLKRGEGTDPLGGLVS